MAAHPLTPQLQVINEQPLKSAHIVRLGCLFVKHYLRSCLPALVTVFIRISAQPQIRISAHLE